jgi:hypothetical protein
MPPGRARRQFTTKRRRRLRAGRARDARYTRIAVGQAAQALGVSRSSLYAAWRG